MEDLIDVNIIFISICLAIFYKYIISDDNIIIQNKI